MLLAEKNRRPGVKILMSGGTRCNITNARGLRRLEVVSGPIDPTYDRRSRAASGPSSRRSATTERSSAHRCAGSTSMRRCGCSRTPASRPRSKATARSSRSPTAPPTCSTHWSRRLERSGATLRCQSPVLEIERIDGEPGRRARFHGQAAGFVRDRPSRDRRRGRCLVPGLRHHRRRLCDRADASATRSSTRSRPWCRSRSRRTGFRSLKGLSLPDVVASVYSRDGTSCIQERREAVLFAHFGLSGPAILDVSRAVGALRRWRVAHPSSRPGADHVAR